MALLMVGSGFTSGWFSRPNKTPDEEAPAIVWRSSNGTVLATGTPSKGRSYFFNNLESVTFSAPEHKSNGVIITTKP